LAPRQSRAFREIFQLVRAELSQAEGKGEEDANPEDLNEAH
jgi:hypothetical protein